MKNEEKRDLFRVEFSSEVFAMAPDLYVGLIVVPRVETIEPFSELNVPSLLEHMETELLESGLSKDKVGEVPTIAAWRTVYSKFGAKPAKYPCAVESLIKRVLDQGSLPRIHSLVDLCNAVSLKSRLPVASCDIKGIQELTIRRATGTEMYIPIGKAGDVSYPEEGEVIYADESNHAHSRRWNWRQSDRLKTTENSRQMLFTVEAVHPQARVLVEATTFLLLDLLQPFIPNGCYEMAFIHTGNRSQPFRMEQIEGREANADIED
ncbi:B3/B4 domain-containing protein [Paenibacillus wynnii]|uniref:B3/B4 domain-containing protein n=1 Tax=Paenibacillus wynnii TaxID=268407 RepID=UPI00278D8DBF|nr:phenylalanine--tRNA ligase beta subunit-related protein [Paenibacillus wynnii]MDQ0196480.1 DNA/RNA-binding domain of Phe-tRNA-synthetase-like protein [Paenibacillus wynnii]